MNFVDLVIDIGLPEGLESKLSEIEEKSRKTQEAVEEIESSLNDVVYEVKIDFTSYDFEDSTSLQRTHSTSADDLEGSGYNFEYDVEYEATTRKVDVSFSIGSGVVKYADDTSESVATFSDRREVLKELPTLSQGQALIEYEIARAVFGGDELHPDTKERLANWMLLDQNAKTLFNYKLTTAAVPTNNVNIGFR